MSAVRLFGRLGSDAEILIRVEGTKQNLSRRSADFGPVWRIWEERPMRDPIGRMPQGLCTDIRPHAPHRIGEPENVYGIHC